MWVEIAFRGGVRGEQGSLVLAPGGGRPPGSYWQHFTHLWPSRAAFPGMRPDKSFLSECIPSLTCAPLSSAQDEGMLFDLFSKRRSHSADTSVSNECLQFNISYPDTGCQKKLEVDDENKLCATVDAFQHAAMTSSRLLES